MKINELVQQVDSGTIVSDIELQREIVYDDEKQRLVIDSIVKGIPLPAFYFWKNDNGKLEVLDGKQRIYAITRFYHNDLEYDGKIRRVTDSSIQAIIDNTVIRDIVCEGQESLKREIFRRINTLGVPLSEYEVLNGLFYGEYLRGLTSYCENDRNAKKILGAPARGAARLTLLRLLGVIRIFSGRDGVYDYVSSHQNQSFEDDQKEIKKYVDFVADIFESYGGQLPIYFNLAIKHVKDIAIWKQHKGEINDRIKAYLKSDDAKLTNHAKEIKDIIHAIVAGISVDPKRLFTADDKEALLKKAVCKDNKYQCAICKMWFTADELQVDHVKPWDKGGRTVLSNAQLLCRACNIHKSDDEDDDD